MGIFRICYENVARCEVDVGVGFVVGECAVSLVVVGAANVADALKRFPPDGLIALQQDVDVDVFAVHLEQLLVALHGIDERIVDIQVVAIYGDASEWLLSEIVRAHVLHRFFDERMQRADALIVVDCS